jgi:hypothetical protein
MGSLLFCLRQVAAVAESTDLSFEYFSGFLMS